MKSPLIIGNWKMQGQSQVSAELLHHIRSNLNKSSAQVVICPPIPYLGLARDTLSGSVIQWGAQDVSAFENGAHTGDVSASMLVDFGCTMVIVGHSERRASHQESNALILEKFRMARTHGLTPVLCVGETLAQRDAGEAIAVIESQLSDLCNLSEKVSEVIIAYEPIWAIGTGRTATPDQVQSMHAAIRQWMRLQLPGVTIKLLYGGSVKAQNAAELLRLPDVDGALVGGASLHAAEFLAICHSGDLIS